LASFHLPFFFLRSTPFPHFDNVSPFPANELVHFPIGAPFFIEFVSKLLFVIFFYISPSPAVGLAFRLQHFLFLGRVRSS